MASTVLLQRDGAIATVELNRPEAGNAIDLAAARTLLEVATTCDEDESIRCVVLRGAGRMFCVGGDVRSFSAVGVELPSLLKEITTAVHGAIARFAQMNKPLLTAINGPAAGVGLSLALLGDIAIAARSAHFTSAYTALGLSPDGGATWLLPRVVGLRKAQELFVLNTRVPADEAAALGMITRCCDDADFPGEVQEMAARLASSATPALGRIRNLLLDSFGTSLEQQMDVEARSIAQLSRTPEGREGVAAFVAKRRPDFTG